MTRLGLQTHLGLREDVHIVGESGDGGEAIRQIENARPDVLILGLNSTGETDAIELCRQSKALEDAPRVLVYTSSIIPEDLASRFLAGADGLLHKSAGGQTLLDAIESCAEGNGPWQAETEIEVPRSRTAGGPEGVDLTARERQVMELILRRYSYSEMGEALHVSPNTAKNHVRNILKKFGAGSRRELLSGTPVAAA